MEGVETWHVPNGPEATAALSQAFFQLTDYPVEDRAKVPVEDLDLGGGRTLHVPKSLKGVAVFSFKRLCGGNCGAADYLAIARRYHTVILSGDWKQLPIVHEQRGICITAGTAATRWHGERMDYGLAMDVLRPSRHVSAETYQPDPNSFWAEAMARIRRRCMPPD